MSARQSQLHQYLTFTLGEELFALDIGSVREILDEKNITRIPRTPEFMRGVINLRGHAVPVMDLRMKFDMSATEMDVDTCVIITEIEIEGSMAIIGALADAVQEVIELPDEDIDPAPRMGTEIDTRFIRGMGKRDGRFILILDVDRIFSLEEMTEIAASAVQDDAEPADDADQTGAPMPDEAEAPASTASITTLL